MPDRVAPQSMEWGLVTRCRVGEATSGDLAVLAPLPGGAIVAGIDGLGHGEEAARAARAAAAVIMQNRSRDLAQLMRRCHVALQGTRGAAISLAFLSSAQSTITWLGVGNVEGRVLSAEPAARGPKASLSLGRGVAGHELPTMVAATLEVRTGDVLILATDGIAPTFADALDLSGSTQAISDRVLAEYWKQNDDALVVAVRYLGTPT